MIVTSKAVLALSTVLSAALTLAIVAKANRVVEAGQANSGAAGARLLAGAIDLHLHVDPKAYGADFETLRLARSRGMRGVVIKNHYEPTVDLAYLLRKEMPNFELFGGLDLNWIAGGLNLTEVNHMAEVPGKPGRFVWLTTLDSDNAVRATKQDRPSIHIMRDGELLPDVKQIISVIAKNGFVLATGHVSPAEGLMLLREGKRQGVEHMVVTHPMDNPVFMTVEQMQEAARLGAFNEFDFRNTLTGGRAEAIRQIGPQACFISEFWTKSQPLQYAGLEGVGEFAEAMRARGFTDGELDLMFKQNPARILGLQ